MSKSYQIHIKYRCYEEGKAVGGSWNDTGYDVRVESMQNYTGASPYVGFRPVMVMKK